MNIADIAQRALAYLPPQAAAPLEAGLRKLPPVRRALEKQYETMVGKLDHSLHPYDAEHPTHATLPRRGVDRSELLRELEAMAEAEKPKWRDGFVSGAVYHGGDEHIAFLHRAYELHSQTNPLHADLFPSVVKMEAEIVSMTADLLGKNARGEDALGTNGSPGAASISGTVTSGGTESILLAMKTYRDHARATRGIHKPAMVVPSTAHAAFDKAASYFGIEKITVPVGPDFRADVAATRRAITKNTVVVVGSAPSFPHGAIDPIPELAALAQSQGIGFHTDACLGAFLLPFANELGYRIPAFDFRVPGVTSMSADTHKFGYALKGTSVVLYRGDELRRFQYYVTTEWPGGLYFSPTLAGSRPGGLSAACWAAMVATGREGYLDAAAKIFAAAQRLKEGVAAIEELQVLGDPLFVIAFASKVVDVYAVMDAMARRGWSLNGLHKPACVHVCVTLRHAQPGVVDRFLADLRASVDEARKAGPRPDGMAPIYGLGASLPFRGVVAELLRRYVDALYRVRP